MKTLFLNVRQMMLWGLVLLVGALFTGTAHATEGGFSISATNETIAQGTLGSSSITVTPVNGYTGNITFAVTASNPALTNGCVLFSNYANVSGVNPTTVGNLTIATQNLACPPNSIGNQIGGERLVRFVRLALCGAEIQRALSLWKPLWAVAC